ncbi:MAG: hypothetical protein IJA78_04510 [Clostridia bacterium]|nr:hypothetical protein [Clostridia bacterium]
MTKRKKRLLIVLISILCILVLLFSLFWFVPYRRHWTFRKKAVETATLFPVPDEVVICNGEAEWMDADDIGTIYRNLVQLESLVTSDDGFYKMRYHQDITDEYRTGQLCVELRYRQRYQYAGNFFNGSSFEYDALLLVLLEDEMIVIPYKGLNYRGINKLYRTLSYHIDRDRDVEEYVEFKNYIAGLS